MKTLLALLLALAAALPAAEPVKRYITLDGTKLLSKPSAFSKNYGSLKKGQAVWAEPAQGGYFKVRAESPSSAGKYLGYIKGLALQDKKPKFGSNLNTRGASGEEVAAATKGFNKQIEAEYSKKNAALDYAGLDSLLRRTKQDPEANAEFQRQGRLGEHSDAAKEAGNE